MWDDVDLKYEALYPTIEIQRCSWPLLSVLVRVLRVRVVIDSLSSERVKARLRLRYAVVACLLEDCMPWCGMAACAAVKHAAAAQPWLHDEQVLHRRHSRAYRVDHQAFN